MSPINGQNRVLKEALEKALIERGITLPVYWGNRNWAPYLEEVVTEASANGHNTLLAFATSAYSSFSSCRQYREDFARVLEETGLGETVTIDKIRPFYDHPGFVEAFETGVREAVEGFLAEGIAAADIQILFSTHSIPTADAERSGARDIEWERVAHTPRSTSPSPRGSWTAFARPFRRPPMCRGNSCTSPAPAPHRSPGSSRTCAM